MKTVSVSHNRQIVSDDYLTKRDGSSFKSLVLQQSSRNMKVVKP